MEEGLRATPIRAIKGLEQFLAANRPRTLIQMAKRRRTREWPLQDRGCVRSQWPFVLWYLGTGYLCVWLREETSLGLS
jgi:hypothetical protein